MAVVYDIIVGDRTLGRKDTGTNCSLGQRSSRQLKNGKDQLGETSTDV